MCLVDLPRAAAGPDARLDVARLQDQRKHRPEERTSDEHETQNDAVDKYLLYRGLGVECETPEDDVGRHVYGNEA